MLLFQFCFFFFFFNDTATTEIYTLSLHDALPIRDRLRASVGECLLSTGHRPDLRSAGRRREVLRLVARTRVPGTGGIADLRDLVPGNPDVGLAVAGSAEGPRSRGVPGSSA